VGQGGSRTCPGAQTGGPRHQPTEEGDSELEGEGEEEEEEEEEEEKEEEDCLGL